MPSYLINQATGTITANGVHVVVPRTDPNVSGRFGVRGSGVFGSATVQLGFVDTETGLIFTPYTNDDFVVVDAFADAFSLQADVGKFSNMAINLLASTGTTNIALDITPIN